MIKNIIFDLGNVLLDQRTVTADVYLSKVMDIPPEEAKDFYTMHIRDAVTGRISFRQLVDLFKQKFNSTKDIKEIVDGYGRLYAADVRRVDGDLLDLIKLLGRNYSIYIMTNTLEPHFDHWKNLGFDQYFKNVFRSDTDHFMKPDKEAYEFVLGQIGVKGEDCVFIDDLTANVKGAEAVGMKGIVYKNPGQLRDDLEKMGIVI